MRHNAIAVVSVITMGVVFAVASPRVDAAPVDCEADRCAIQADIDAECSCADAKNHGRYTSCVARVVNRAAREGRIQKKCRNAINGCSIRSTCGKREGTVLCDQAGDGVSGRCRPLSSEAACLKRGGTVVSTCCDSCSVEPSPSPTSTAPTPTPGGPTVTPGDATPTTGQATATPETPEATPTETVGAPTATPETPEPSPTPSVDLTATPAATATVETPVGTVTPEATATVETPVATATPEEPVPTATTEPEATATVETPVPTATPEEPLPTVTVEPVATATIETPIPTATPEEPIATATVEEPVATATPEPEATATEEPIPSATATPDVL